MYKGLYYIYIVAKNTLNQKRKVVFQMFNHTIFIVFSIYLYRYVYALVPSMQSKLPFPNAIWSMSVYYVVFWLAFRNIEKNFREDIRTGNIEMYLLRPISYIWQKVFIQTGQGLISFTIAAILAVVLAYNLVGLPVIDAPTILWVFGIIILFILSQTLICLLFILCGLSGFWIGDSEPTYYIMSKFMMIFGGAWVPVAFFPKALQLFATYSPFGPSMALSFAMYPNFMERFPILVVTTTIWIIICAVLVSIISKRAFNKLAVNG